MSNSLFKYETTKYREKIRYPHTILSVLKEIYASDNVSLVSCRFPPPPPPLTPHKLSKHLDYIMNVTMLERTSLYL